MKLQAIALFLRASQLHMSDSTENSVSLNNAFILQLTLKWIAGTEFLPIYMS